MNGNEKQPMDEQTALPVTEQVYLKQPYQSPHVITYGSVVTLTQGSGGNYLDECTSGKWQDDE